MDFYDKDMLCFFYRKEHEYEVLSRLYFQVLFIPKT